MDNADILQYIDQIESYFHRFYAWVAALCISAGTAIWTPMALVVAGKTGVSAPRRKVACVNSWVFLVVCVLIVYALYDVMRLMWNLGREWMVTNIVIAIVVILSVWPMLSILRGVSRVDTVDYEQFGAPCVVVGMGVLVLSCLPMVIDMEEVLVKSEDLIKTTFNEDEGELTDDQKKKLEDVSNDFMTILEDLPSIRKSAFVLVGSSVAVALYIWAMWTYAPIPRPAAKPALESNNRTFVGRIARSLCLA